MRYAILALALISCSKKDPPARIEVRPVEASAPAPAPPKPVVRAAAFANFFKGRLWECLDMSITLPAGIDAGPEDPFAEMHEKAEKEVKRIDQPCTEAFGDRTVLASCTFARVGDAGESINMTSHLYNYEDVGLSDEQMSECFEMKGRWNAIPRTSPEWRRAKLDYDQRRLGKAVDKLNELQP